MKNITPVFLGVICVFLIGCSGGSPTNPDVQPMNDVTNRLEDVNLQSNSHLLGLWDVFVNPEEATVEIIPSRGLAFTANVTRFIDGPPSSLLFKDIVIDFQPEYVDLSVDFGFRHPFPGMDQFTIFDTLGVFLGNGSYTYPGPGNFAIAGESDQQLLNPDGYTRWFNAPEFEAAGLEMPIFGYYPGANCPPDYFPSAVLNGYKYFADWLDEDGSAFEFLVPNSGNRGSIGSMSINYRRYDLRFPNDLILYFQYAFVAHWEPNINHPGPPGSLDDFPPNANADEAVVVEINSDESTLYFVDENTFGGNVCLDISPWDWSATPNQDGFMEEYQIRCYSDAWTGGHDVNMFPIFQDEFFSTYKTIIPVENLASSDPLKVMVEIIYPGLDYTNIYGIENDADGPLTGYFIVNIPVGEDPYTGWARTWGGSFQDSGGGVATDDSGNVYITGSFEGTVDFDPDGGDTHTSNGEADVFLSKFDSTGNFLWVRTWGGLKKEHSFGVTLDGSENVYVVGDFFDTVDFDPDGGDPHTSNGALDAYLSKFDSSGNFQWARTWGGLEMEQGFGITLDGSENVYVVGTFAETTDLDPDGGDQHTSNGTNDCFLSKFDSSGNFEWGRTWGGISIDLSVEVAAEGAGNVYVTGFFSDTVDFDPGGGDSRTSNGLWDIFLTTFDSSGNFQWVQTWGGSMSDGAGGVDSDGFGNVYVTGSFKETVDFNPGGGDPHTSNGDGDAFLSKFDSSGNYMWARTWGGSMHDSGQEVDVDGSGHVYVTGYFYETVEFNPGGGDVHTSNGLVDAFLSTFDSTGNFNWARTWGGTGKDGGGSVSADEAGYIYVVGFFNDLVDFAPTGPPCYDNLDEHKSNGNYDAFLVKYSMDGCW